MPTVDAGSTAKLDRVPSYARYRAETGHIWFVSIASGFQIVELTEQAGLDRADPVVCKHGRHWRDSSRQK